MGLQEEGGGPVPTGRHRRKAHLALSKYSMCLGKDAPLLVRAPLEWVGLFRGEEEVTQSGSVTDYNRSSSLPFTQAFPQA